MQLRENLGRETTLLLCTPRKHMTTSGRGKTSERNNTIVLNEGVVLTSELQLQRFFE